MNAALLSRIRDRSARLGVVGQGYVGLPLAVAAVEAEWGQGAIDVVTATSGELLRCLYEILSPAGRSLLAGSALLVGGPRIGAIARQIGITGPLIVAARPDDEALVDALLIWRRHTNGP